MVAFLKGDEEMFFNWKRLEKKMFQSYTKEMLRPDERDLIGFIHVGEICIDVFIQNRGIPVIEFDFYVAHEDTGYGYNEKFKFPYDYAEGFDMCEPPKNYKSFVVKAEKMIRTYIKENDTRYGYSLLKKANMPLLAWN